MTLGTTEVTIAQLLDDNSIKTSIFAKRSAGKQGMQTMKIYNNSGTATIYIISSARLEGVTELTALNEGIPIASYNFFAENVVNPLLWRIVSSEAATDVRIDIR